MHIVVDGYNFLRCSPLAAAERRGLEQGREAVCQWLAGLRRARGHEITVIFDGDLQTAPPLPGHYAGVRVEFAPSADAAIGEQARSGQLVVTSDRAVQRAVERAGAVPCSSEDFWRHADALVAADSGGDEQAAAGAGDAEAGAVGADGAVAGTDGTGGDGGAGGRGGADDRGGADGTSDLDIGDDWTKALDDPRLWALAEADASAPGTVKGGQRQTKRGRRLSKRESRLRSMLERL